MNKFYQGSSFQRGFGLGGVYRGATYQRVYGLGCVYRGAPYQKGYGLGGVWRKFYSLIAPLLGKVKNIALPLLKSGAQNVGKEMLRSVTEIANDRIDGNNQSAADCLYKLLLKWY